MLALALLLSMVVQPHAPLDSVAAYSAILHQVRAEFPGRPLVLAEARSAVACMPLCGAGLRDPDGSAVPAPPRIEARHSAPLLGALRDRGLVEHTCAVLDGEMGCAGHAQHLFVALGEIETAPVNGPPPVEGGWWVKAAFLLPDACGHAAEARAPDAFGYWHLLRQRTDGGWTIVRRAPAFAV